MRERLRRLLDRLLSAVPVPPARAPVEGDGVLDNLDELPPAERDARMRVWHSRTRRGRGDGWG